MRRVISVFLLAIIALGLAVSLTKIPFGEPKTVVGGNYVSEGIEDTGATNIVGSVVTNYRGFDTLGEVTILFVAALGLSAVFATYKKKKVKKTEASLILTSGCSLLFPLLLLIGIYIVLHGHLTPGGGFQGGAVVASAFLLARLVSREKRISKKGSKIAGSLGGLVFVLIGLVGLTAGGYFLFNFLPKGTPFSLVSAGIIPLIYIAIGFKVGSELADIIDNLVG